MPELPDLTADLEALTERELEEKKSVARAAGAAMRAGAFTLLALLASDARATPDTRPAPNAAGEGVGVAPPLGLAVEPPLPLPALSPNPERLAAARALLAEGTVASAESTLGGYLFLTDIADPRLIARATAVVDGLEKTYFERYGRRPVGAPREAIVLFQSEKDYRRFQAGDPRLAGLSGSTGLAGRGLVATFQGERSGDELLGTLVHELGHLLNRRALGPSLPSWLDEGLADDLGASRIDPEGQLHPGSWSRTLESQGPEIRISGGEAALRDLAELYGPDGANAGRFDLGAMLALEWEEFVEEESAELHYAVATAFIRMLLAAPTSNALFRDWLAAVAAGGSPAAEALRLKLDRPWSELDRALALWTRAEFARLPALRPAAIGSAAASKRAQAFAAGPSAPDRLRLGDLGDAPPR
ncbi:MAG: hypothetical protein ABIV06_14840 [Thermoanaerobaculia bacterium]